MVFVRDCLSTILLYVESLVLLVEKSTYSVILKFSEGLTRHLTKNKTSYNLYQNIIGKRFVLMSLDLGQDLLTTSFSSVCLQIA